MPYPWRKRLFLLLLPLFLAAVYLTVRVETDLNSFFTATGDEDAAFLAGFLQSGELSRRTLIAVEAGPGSGAGLSAFAQDLAARLAALPGVARVWAADRPPEEWLSQLHARARFHARIFSLEPEAEAQALFDPAGLKDRAEALKQALLSPQGTLLKPVAKDDPLLLSLRAFRGMEDRFQGRADGGFAGLVLQSTAPALDTEAQGRLQAAARAAFDQLNAGVGGRYTLAMTGVPVFTVAAEGQIARDVAVVSAVSTVAVALIFLALFRSLMALHWVLLIVAASYGAGTLATVLAFGTVHSLTLALGSTLTGVSIDYPMHVLAHAAQHRGESPGKAVSLVWPSLFVGALTTILGYLALGCTGFPGFRQIAVFSAAAILAALLLTRWVLPALLAGSALRPPGVIGLSGWLDFCRRRRRPLLAVLAAGLAGTAALLPEARWMDDLSRLAMDMGPLKQQDRRIRAHMAGIEPGRFVLVQAGDMETALQYSEAAERRLRKLKEAGGLKEYFGIFPWLVSARLQADNAAAYARGGTEQFQAAWRAALADAGLSVEKLGRLAPVSEPLPESPESPETRRILAGQIVEQADGVALVIWLGAHDPAAVAAAVADLPGVRYFSQKDLLDRLARGYRDESLVMLGWGLLAIYGLLWLRYRHPGKAFFALLPALVASFAVFAAWAALGQEVSFLHVMCLLLAVSICEDYGIFFLDNGGGDIQATYQAIAPSMLTTAVSFAALGLAENPTLRTLAAAVTLGVVLGFLLCPVLIRAQGHGGGRPG